MTHTLGLRVIVHDLFVASFILLISGFIAEQFFVGIMTRYMSLSVLLGVTFLLGVLALFSNAFTFPKKRGLTP